LSAPTFPNPESAQYLGVPRLVLTGLTALCTRPRLTWVWAIVGNPGTPKKASGEIPELANK